MVAFYFKSDNFSGIDENKIHFMKEEHGGAEDYVKLSAPSVSFSLFTITKFMNT